MTGKSDAGIARFFELGALEHEGVLWYFTLSGPHGGISLKYRSEEGARRARMLIFEALKDVVQPGTETGMRHPSRRTAILLKKAGSLFRWRQRSRLGHGKKGQS